ncbi:MAG: malto-oligosyltrehalose trehalohydrolase [Rhizomicrobium sp.]
MTHFRLWAPAHPRVDLELSGRIVPMRPASDGWHAADVPAPAGARYRFRIGDVAVPDPASRRQDDEWSVVTDPDAYRWQDAAWRGRPWEETVLYELHAGLMGGFEGIEDRLPALAELGVTAVELMPIAQFPGNRNWGYDGALPYAPAAVYGTPDDLKRLVDRAHGLELMVFLDVVYNHFGPDGNYLPLYAPGFFREDRHTPWGAGIDFRKEQVRRFFIDNALYWVREFHIDGLRLDAVHAIGDDGFVADLAHAVRDGAAGRQVHLVIENEHNDARLLAEGGFAQWNDDFHHAVHVLLTGESEGYYGPYADAPARGLATSLAGGFICDRSGPGPRLSPTAFVNFLQNHDHVGNRAFGERLTVLADETALQAAIGLLLLAPPIPLIFFGEEAGARESFLYFCDHADDKLADAVREGRRNEFAKFSEFRDPAQRARIPDPNAPETFARSRPRLDGGAEWRALYKELLALRRAHIVPRLKDCIAEGADVVGPKAVLASWRLGDGTRLTILANLGREDVSCSLPEATPIWDRAGTRCWIET